MESAATRNRKPRKPLPAGAISLHAARNHTHVCPTCGAVARGCVTSHGDGRHVVRIEFMCGETFTRPLKRVGG
jgi:hypothetical protein